MNATNIVLCWLYLIALSLFIQNKYFFGFKYELLRALRCWLTLYQWRAERLACDVTGTVATHASFVCDITDADCCARNSSTQESRLGFHNFHTLIFKIRTWNWMKNCCVYIYVLFLPIRPGMFYFGSPLKSDILISKKTNNPPPPHFTPYSSINC